MRRDGVRAAGVPILLLENECSDSERRWSQESSGVYQSRELRFAASGGVQ